MVTSLEKVVVDRKDDEIILRKQSAMATTD